MFVRIDFEKKYKETNILASALSLNEIQGFYFVYTLNRPSNVIAVTKLTLKCKRQSCLQHFFKIQVHNFAFLGSHIFLNQTSGPFLFYQTAAVS